MKMGEKKMNIALAFCSEMTYLSRSPGMVDRKGSREIESVHAKEVRHLMMITNEILLFPGIAERDKQNHGGIRHTRVKYKLQGVIITTGRSEKKDIERELRAPPIVCTNLLDECTHTFPDTALRLPGVVTEGH